MRIPSHMRVVDTHMYIFLYVRLIHNLFGRFSQNESFLKYVVQSKLPLNIEEVTEVEQYLSFENVQHKRIQVLINKSVRRSTKFINQKIRNMKKFDLVQNIYMLNNISFLFHVKIVIIYKCKYINEFIFNMQNISSFFHFSIKRDLD